MVVVKAAPVPVALLSRRGGQLTKGYRTRNSKRTDSMIIQRRYDK